MQKAFWSFKKIKYKFTLEIFCRRKKQVSQASVPASLFINIFTLKIFCRRKKQVSQASVPTSLFINIQKLGFFQTITIKCSYGALQSQFLKNKQKFNIHSNYRKRAFLRRFALGNKIFFLLFLFFKTLSIISGWGRTWTKWNNKMRIS